MIISDVAFLASSEEGRRCACGQRHCFFSFEEEDIAPVDRDIGFIGNLL